jgi:hypothetical protein
LPSSSRSKTIATKIVLSRTAPWATPDEIRANVRLRNGYRERFAYVNGRCFRIDAEYRDSTWYIEEVEPDGEPLIGRDEHGDRIVVRDDDGRFQTFDFGFGRWASTLAEAREIIAAEVGR